MPDQKCGIPSPIPGRVARKEKKMSRSLRYTITGLVFCSLAVSVGRSQSTFGSITGTVTDPASALVPDAEVEVINEGTGATRRVTTGAAGVFNVPNLDLGTYRVRVTGTGFNTYERAGLNLTANQIINLDIQLTLGATTTRVEVQGVTPVIATETQD